MARIIDYEKSPHEVLGTRANDTITLKGAVPLAVFGGGGNDTILTSVNTTRDVIYGGYSVPNPDQSDPRGPYYGHLMPGLTMTQLRANWAHDGRDTGHGGNGDWMELGSDADDFIWHPNPGGYTAPGVNRGLNPDEGDVMIFAHDNGFTVDRVIGTQAGDFWDISQVDMHGRDTDFLLDGQWMRLDFRSDRRGPGVDPLTGVGDHHVRIPVESSMIADTRDWLREHDAGFYNPGGDNGFIF
jgi:hypothetical protein